MTSNFRRYFFPVLLLVVVATPFFVDLKYYGYFFNIVRSNLTVSLSILASASAVFSYLFFYSYKIAFFAYLLMIAIVFNHDFARIADDVFSMVRITFF